MKTTTYLGMTVYYSSSLKRAPKAINIAQALRAYIGEFTLHTLQAIGNAIQLEFDLASEKWNVEEIFFQP